MQRQEDPGVHWKANFAQSVHPGSEEDPVCEKGRHHQPMASTGMHKHMHTYEHIHTYVTRMQKKKKN